MPLHRLWLKRAKQSAAYDLSSAGNGAGKQARAPDHQDDGATVYGISIAQHEQFSYIPNMNTTKSLATDIIQLTRYKNRRPTVQEERPQRKPSFRNIFLGVPEPVRRRFSEDIRGANLALAVAAAGSTSGGGGGGGGALAGAFKNSETKRVLILQVFIPFLLSGFGNVGAGLLINQAQNWRVFKDNTVFYMLLATFMAFKTNLEATLAARLSTCSNMGSMPTASKKLQAFLGNLAMVLMQSVIFGLMAAGLVLMIGYCTAPEALTWELALRLTATSLTAICANELLSSGLILAVVLGSERAGVNPDNVSTLIAAMFGDFTSVLFISLTAALFHAHQHLDTLFKALTLGLTCGLPAAAYLSAQNPFTRGMFLCTHVPLTLAVTVAALSGLVFDHAVRSFARIAIYQAVVNGISVNLMAVQASRISTYLQQLNSVAPDQAISYAAQCSPVRALYARDMNASVARWLIAMCLPAMSVYLCFIFAVAPAYVDVTLLLVACCLVAILVQVTFIQSLTYLVTTVAWRLNWDPDNVVIPVLMSISDCSGNAILLTAFIFLRRMADPNSLSPADLEQPVAINVAD